MRHSISNLPSLTGQGKQAVGAAFKEQEGFEADQQTFLSPQEIS